MERESGFYRALRRIAAPLRWYFRLRVEGAEQMPATGACLLAANHSSYLDPIVLGMACPRQVHFIMDRQYYESRWIHWACVRAGAIPVENNPRDIGSLRRSLQALRDGKVVAIFPEGGRSDDGTRRPARPGVALLALRAGVPVLPAGIVGAWESLPRHRFWPRRVPIRVRWGEPLRFPAEWLGHGARDHLDEATEMIMDAVARLMRS